MGQVDVNPAHIEAIRQSETEMMNWADWWEQRSNEVFDAPAVLVDIEPLPN